MNNKAVSGFPKGEEYSSNIAEGAARQTRKEFVQFLYVASGSASEIETQLELAWRLGYLSDEARAELSTELDIISKMISSLIKSQRVSN